MDCFRGIASSLNRYFREDGSSPFNIVWFRLEEWKDAFYISFDPERPEFVRLAQHVDKILLHPDKYRNDKVLLAQKVAAILDDPGLPQVAKDKLVEIRARPCHPDCEITS